MASSRADAQTQTSKQKEYYSDFFDSFANSPIGGDLSRITNERSVKQSIRNLVLTNLGGFDLNTNNRVAGERLFQPLLGTDVNRSLFELSDVSTFATVKTSIEDAIRNNEPRASNVTVEVTGENDLEYMQIYVTFAIINTTTPVSVTLNLKRVR